MDFFSFLEHNHTHAHTLTCMLIFADQYQPLSGPHINQVIMREEARSKGETIPCGRTRIVVSEGPVRGVEKY